MGICLNFLIERKLAGVRTWLQTNKTQFAFAVFLLMFVVFGHDDEMMI